LREDSRGERKGDQVMKDIAVIVAHPDDETLWYGGTIISNKSVNWHIVCVTDGGDGRDGARRCGEFESACGALGAASTQVLGYPDGFRRPIDVRRLVQDLKARMPASIEAVLTHGFSDVHHHHREVLIACCLAFEHCELGMFAPSYRVPPHVGREKHRLLREGYPSQIWSEELLLRYPWWLEGAVQPDLSIAGSFPLKTSLIHEETWNGLEASGVLCANTPVQMQVRVSKAASDSLGTRFAERGCIDRALLLGMRRTGADRIAAGRSHHLNEVAALVLLLQGLAERDLLFVCETKDPKGDSAISFWARDGDRLRLVMAPRVLCAEDLQQIQGIALQEGVRELWLAVGRYADSIQALEQFTEVDLGASMFEECGCLATLWGHW